MYFAPRCTRRHQHLHFWISVSNQFEEHYRNDNPPRFKPMSSWSWGVCSTSTLQPLPWEQINDPICKKTSNKCKRNCHKFDTCFHYFFPNSTLISSQKMALQGFFLLSTLCRGVIRTHARRVASDWDLQSSREWATALRQEKFRSKRTQKVKNF